MPRRPYSLWEGLQPRCPSRATALLLLVHRMRPEELHQLHRRPHAIGLLPPSVALVREQHVRRRDAALLQRFDDLLGFDLAAFSTGRGEVIPRAWCSAKTPY